MASVNKVIIVGNLGQDPETRYAPSGNCICNISVATSDQWTDKASGEKKEQTEWHRIVLFKRLGEVAGEYLKKGSSVYIEGKLKTRSWEDKEGVTRYTTEIVADVMQMLGSKHQGEAATQAPRQSRPASPPAQRPRAPAKAGGGFDDMDDDIPF